MLAIILTAIGSAQTVKGDQKMLSKFDEILLDILLVIAVTAIIAVLVFLVYYVGGAMALWPLSEVMVKR
jgi:hypothetical protein